MDVERSAMVGRGALANERVRCGRREFLLGRVVCGSRVTFGACVPSFLSRESFNVGF
jgi:hypothetical protein